MHFSFFVATRSAFYFQEWPPVLQAYLRYSPQLHLSDDSPTLCILCVHTDANKRSYKRPCYQRGSLCQDPAGNQTTRRPGHRKETQTEVVWTYLHFIRSGQNHLARHNERGKKTRQTEKEVGRQHQGMDRHGVRQVPEGSGEQIKMQETGCEVICCAPTTPMVKGWAKMKVKANKRPLLLVWENTTDSKPAAPLTSALRWDLFRLHHHWLTSICSWGRGGLPGGEK